MAKRKNSGAGGILGALVLGAFALIASIPREVWIFLFGCGVAWLVYTLLKALGQNKASNDADAPAEHKNPFRESVDRSARSSPATRTRVPDEPVTTSTKPGSDTAGEFRIPTAPASFGAARWIPAGESIRVGGVEIPGGFVYVGTTLKTPSGANDPCLIDPTKPVAGKGDFTERQFSYWPSYSEISASARKAYLNWLAGGRKDPNADIGYVFLFFYGLERRAIIDFQSDAAVEAELSAIADEIRRLLGIYANGSGSFKRYASELLDWVSLVRPMKQLYLCQVPEFPKTFELPLYLRLALGQAAVDAAPVPAPLALAWAKLDPNIVFRTPASRCPEQFEQLFARKYAEDLGEGLVLPRNRTKLKFIYRPASAGFRGYNEVQLSFGSIPDVTALTSPLKKLQEVVEAATKGLEPYSRFIGKNPGSRTALEGLLQLPTALWPEPARRALDDLRARMSEGILAMPTQELLDALGAKSTPTKEKVLALAKALASANIGLEPDVLSGAKPPKASGKVVVFTIQPSESLSRTTAAYQAAALTLQLASVVATADGDFTAKEMTWLASHVKSWTHLPPGQIRRLLAHLRLLVDEPTSLTALAKKLAPLDIAARETLAWFMSTLAQSDGTVSPAEVKALEKVYKALGVDTKKVFVDVHAAATGAPPVAPEASRPSGQPGFKLDPARIAALQQDTARVNELLMGIFKEEAAPIDALAEQDAEGSDEVEASGILGLDEAHTALARLLLSRPQWSREELQDVVADLDLMVDGALERINEAAFDNLDIPFTEGDDPVEVNAEVLEKLAA